MKSLQPSVDPEYILISKKALLVNTFVIARLCKLLSVCVDLSPGEIAEEVANYARDKINQQSSEMINIEVQTILDNLETESGVTIVEH